MARCCVCTPLASAVPAAGRAPRTQPASRAASLVAGAKRRTKSGKGGGFRNLMGEQTGGYKQDEEVAELISDVPDGPPDYWEGEKWNSVGTLAQFFAVIVAVLAAGVGSFASSVYNEGAIPVDFAAAESSAEAIKAGMDSGAYLSVAPFTADESADARVSKGVKYL